MYICIYNLYAFKTFMCMYVCMYDFSAFKIQYSMYVCMYSELYCMYAWYDNVIIFRQFIPREEVHEVMRTVVAEVSAAHTYIYPSMHAFTFLAIYIHTYIHTYRLSF